MKRASLAPLAFLVTASSACSTESSLGEPPGPDADLGDDESPPGGGDSGDDTSDPGDGEDDEGGDGGDGGDGGEGGDGDEGGDASPQTIPVELVPQAGDAGAERVNFAVPLPRTRLDDPDRLRIEAGGDELPAYVHPIARYPDDSIRSVQVQVDVDVESVSELSVVVGAEASAGALDPVPVEDTLITPDGTEGPRVFALLPPSWLAKTGLVGPVPSATTEAGNTRGAWTNVCDYDRFDTSQFLADSGSRGSWLYDRPAALYRLHARTGELSPLRSAFREAHIYREGITGSGSNTRIGVPTAENDLKYHYTQGMAIAYLLTGDERFRERAEDVATRASDLWSPLYVPGGRFWTERHAGFALLAYVWAARISDDRRDDFLALADEAVSAYREGQLTYPTSYDDPDARCFSHDASSAGEGFGYEGCSPWMSAILADGLEEYAAERGGERAELARDSIVMLGRMLARHSRDGSGKPYYWMAGDGSGGEVDSFDEHWGESAYVIAMAWHHDGRRDDSLRAVAEELIAGLERNGVAPHTRSFNWQCRSAPLTPLYLE